MKAEGAALVTGASRGIGRAIAIELARSGFEVVGGVRRRADGERLEQAARDAGAVLRATELDVDRPETISIPEGLRVLVNNAGVEREYLPVEHQPLEQWREIFETNVFGLVEVTQRAIPALRASGGGVIANVTSSSLLFPQALYAAYRASKAAVAALGESLRAELQPWGIRIVEIMPGPIDTDMLRGSDRTAEAARHPEYREMAEAYLAGRRGVAPMITSAEEAARRIRAAILDDDGPLRYGCDPLSEQALEAWRSSRDEDLMRRVLGI
jgi:NAD(P)-dependent dehydrogenase (short-subunit alcohol dehydrogenase family)